MNFFDDVAAKAKSLSEQHFDRNQLNLLSVSAVDLPQSFSDFLHYIGEPNRLGESHGRMLPTCGGAC